MEVEWRKDEYKIDKQFNKWRKDEEKINTISMSSLTNGGRMERIINAIDEKIIWKKEWEKVKRKEKIHFLGRNGL